MVIGNSCSSRFHQAADQALREDGVAAVAPPSANGFGNSIRISCMQLRFLFLWPPAKFGEKTLSRLILTILFIMGSWLCPAGSAAREAQIGDVLVARQPDRFTVFARVTNCFTSGMESAIMAGVPTTFTFLVDFYRERNFWPDKKIAAVVVRQTVKYDNVKKIFLVSMDHNGNPTAFQDLEGAKRAMAELTAHIAIPRNVDRNRGTYYLLIKAKLDKVRLPLYMEYVFFFVSLWDFETDWYRKEVAF